ncbi:prolyl oligopeptidase family serine peptidase [Salegentibacter sp. LM13S]|uniref:prolyl oligopeptidase family serine peptidase n=1 Tax=Salegentibacter lacus TaxID=2873599 RepID=UPI001CCD5D77|nr:prolyl oligopeptidase family serine peptidase [Salegentibacter lacus]MBZ9632217.1 prolyl oligopeptidase family serine peptidase [Salegentibacter lacus]
MKNKDHLLILCLSLVSITISFGQQKLTQYPSLSKQVATINEFGVTLQDDYDNLNNLEDPIIDQWLKTQDSLSEDYFSKNDLLQDYLEKFEEYQNRENGTTSMIKVNEEGNYFYLKYDDTSGTNKLYFRKDLSSEEEELFDPGNNDEITEITYLKPSFDGEKIAIGYQPDKNFSSRVRIFDVKNKKFYKEEIININPSFGGIEWLPDSSGFIYLYFPVVDQNKPDYKKNSYSVLHKLGNSPAEKKKVFGNSNTVNISADFYPKVKIGSSQDKYIIGYSATSNDYYDAYIARVSDIVSGNENWIPFFNVEQKVYTTEGDIRGDEFIFRQGNNTGNQVSRVKFHSPNFNNPEVLAEGTKENPITQFDITKDKIYYSKSKLGVEVSLWEIDKEKNIAKLKTPFVPGYATFFGGSVKTNLIGVELDGWISNYTRFIITENKDLQKEGLKTETLYPEFENLITEQIMVESHDGVEVPLSLIYDPNLLNSENEVFIYVYGAYGESLSPFFYPIILDWAAQGGILAFPHVRGGGEKGKEWHLQGQKTLKHNSWRDLISCTEALITKGFTKKGLISLYTYSAGGITAGMAVNERPDLFSSYIAEVPRLNPLGLESSATASSTSYLEYGTVKDSLEFEGLVKMDPYFNLNSENKYPPTLILPASQDDRIPLWDSGKYIAKLQSISQGETPILMDIDFHYGHEGQGSDETVKLYSKIFSFARSNMRQDH